MGQMKANWEKQSIDYREEAKVKECMADARVGRNWVGASVAGRRAGGPAGRWNEVFPGLLLT